MQVLQHSLQMQEKVPLSYLSKTIKEFIKNILL